MKLTNGYIYDFGTNDFFIGWAEVSRQGGRWLTRSHIEDGHAMDISSVVTTALKEIVLRSRWEGDGAKHRVWCVAIPMPEDGGSEWPQIAVAVKQNNNGSCYVWSPMELPWLRKELVTGR